MKKEFIFQSISIKDIIVRETKRSEQEGKVESMEFKNKIYYIYIRHGEKYYPVYIPKYQREFKNKQAQDLDSFMDSVEKNTPMTPPIMINFIEIDNMTYAEIIDGQQRIKIVARIKIGAKPKSKNAFKKWTEEERERFNDFAIPCEYYNNLSEEQAKEKFKDVNTKSKPLTSGERRSILINDSNENRIQELIGYSLRVYKATGNKKPETAYRLSILVIETQMKEKALEKNMRFSTISADEDIQKVVSYITEMNTSEYKELKRGIKRISNVFTDVLGDIFSKSEDTFLSNSNGNASKVGNTDIIILSLLMFINENADYEDLLEDNKFIIQKEIENFFNEGKTINAPNLAGKKKYALELKERIENAILL